MAYYTYGQGGYVTEADMFIYDFDGDGEEEEISFYYDEDEYLCTITAGEYVAKFECMDFSGAILMDLDPASPYVNLIVIYDAGSSDYLADELHVENGVLVNGKTLPGHCEVTADGELVVYEPTDLLGTATGWRVYAGDALNPTSKWLQMSRIPSKEELKNERDDLIEFGTLLHATRDVPCEIGGATAVIPAGSYVYRLRYTDTYDRVEVSMEDGTVALIYTEFDRDRYDFQIDGRSVHDYFDNLMFAG